MSAKLIHHKLERALVAFVQANKGERLPGVTIVDGHTSTEPAYPFLVSACLSAHPHPDFEGCGRFFPQLVRVAFCAKGNANDGEEGDRLEHAETLAPWMGDLDEILSEPITTGAPAYSKLIAFLNPPASGTDTRAQKDLFVYAIHPAEDAGNFDGAVFVEVLGLEITVQNGDPST